MSGPQRLLVVVEDDGATRRVLESQFSRRGWEVRPVSGVAEAIGLLDGGTVPDALILDLVLPDGDGESVLHKVRQAGLEVPVVVCTGIINDDRLYRVRGMAPDLILSKPIDVDTLYRLLDSWSRPPK